MAKKIKRASGMTRERPIVVEFFSGAGGLSLGLEQAGFDIALAVDRDGYHVATHERNFPYGLSVCRSVVGLTAKDIRQFLEFEGDIDLVSGGPPCQGFSHMGVRDLTDPRNTLVDEFARLVLELRPKAFLMENVPGMQTGDTALIFDRIVRRFRTNGYKVTFPPKTLVATDFGVPQRRERLFLLGIREEYPNPIAYPVSACPGQPPRPTVAEALSGLPRIEKNDLFFTSDIGAYPDLKLLSLHPYVRAAIGIEVDPSDYSYKRTWNRTQCSGCLRVRHREDIQRLYASTEPGTMVPGHKLPRLDPDGVAPTLRAGSESERGSYTAPRPIHPFQPRCITAREAARLHGYPDWFSFYPNKWQAYRQIGNSVCPPVARAIGRSILQGLGERPRRSRKAFALKDEFTLPADRPKQHKRITQVAEWPKILLHLFERAYDSRSACLRKADFAVDDIKAAYIATHANMPRNPAHRFLADVARSRNVKMLLSPIMAKGFSIIKVSGNGICGQFVPVGTPGTIDEKDIITVSSKDIANAIDMTTVDKHPLSNESLFKYLGSPVVSRVLFPTNKLVVEETDEENSNGSCSCREYRVLSKRCCLSRGIVCSVASSAAPTISKLNTLLHKTGTSSAIILLKLTQKHFAAVIYRKSNGRIEELRRSVFQLIR